MSAIHKILPLSLAGLLVMPSLVFCQEPGVQDSGAQDPVTQDPGAQDSVVQDSVAQDPVAQVSPQEH